MYKDAMKLLFELDPNAYLKLNSSFQKKKNKLRKALADKGLLAKGGQNKFDGYKYFSEAQYKKLFTELFSEYGLELSFTEKAYERFEGIGKQLSGRLIRLEFRLSDIDTGFYELTEISAESMDKGDKAGYQAYTGALKYYLANSFMVATGDDPEKNSPEAKKEPKAESKTEPKEEPKVTPKQLELIRKIAEKSGHGDDLDMNALSEWTVSQASEFITKHTKGANDNE